MQYPTAEAPSAENLTAACRGKSILLTGGAGYLATNVAALLRDTDCRIVRLARTAALPVLAGSATFEGAVGDVRERATWERVLPGIDIVLHFAAQTSVYVANDDPLADWHSNVLPMLHLVETCRTQALHPAVVFASTVTVAGLPERLPVDETAPAKPVTVYDLHKQMAENYLKYAVRQGLLDGTVLRLANVYGPGPKSSRADRGILNQMMRRALAGEALTVYGTGEQLRDYVYVEDAARAFVTAATHAENVQGRHFMIGSACGHTIAAALNLVADRVALRTGRRSEVVHVEPPASLSPIEARNFVADTSRFTAATGWRAEVSLVEGIDATLETFT